MTNLLDGKVVSEVVDAHVAVHTRGTKAVSVDIKSSTSDEKVETGFLLSKLAEDLSRLLEIAQATRVYMTKRAKEGR